MAVKKKVAVKKVAVKKKVVAKIVAIKEKAVATKPDSSVKIVKPAQIVKEVLKKKPEEKFVASKKGILTPKKETYKKIVDLKKPTPPKLEENTFLNLKIAKVMHEDPRTHHDDHEQAPKIEHGPLRPIIRELPKVGRNEPCHCGSGLKYKKCCGKE